MKKTFTLIELLVVIAIIAILAAMLLPALNKARARAQSIKCVSQEKMLGTAFLNYADDYAGYMIPCDWGAGNIWWVKIATTDLKYLRNPQMLLCPSETGPAAFIWGGFPKYGTHYAYNLYIGANERAGGFFSKLSRFKHASKTTVLIDSNYKFYKETSWRFVMQIDAAVSPITDFHLLSYSPDQISTRHSGSCNTLFADGHVKSAVPRVNGVYKGIDYWEPYK